MANPLTTDTRDVVLRCYIRGSGDTWTALCVDLDIAAEGRTLSEAKTTMEEMIESYLETVAGFDPADRDRLLKRKAPLYVRLKLALEFFMASLFATRVSDDRMSFISHHSCPA